MESRTMPPPQASARQTEMGETFNRVLFAVLDALQERSIPHGLIGGVAASGLGRPRSTHDIDIFVRPEDAEAALVALAAKGFETERTDPRWLFKGWKDEMMVDIIFKSSGDIYFDDEMHNRCKLIPYHGRNIPAVSPEDLIIIKCAVHSELGPHHWHDALAILSHATLDYSYLLSRARRATRRVLALLIYAQSNDIWIPNDVIQALFQNIFNTQALTMPGAVTMSSSAQPTGFSEMAQRLSTADRARQDRAPERAIEHRLGDTKKQHCAAYMKSHLHEALASDGRTAHLDCELTVETTERQKILMMGEAPSHQHRTAVEQVVRDHAPGFLIENHIRVLEMTSEASAPVMEELV